MKQDNGKYFFIPDWLLNENSQTIHAYIYILNEINSNGGEFVTTKNEIAKELNITYKKTRIVLDKITKLGQLKGKVRADQKTVYTIDFKIVIEDFETTKGRVRARLGQGNAKAKQPIKERKESFVNDLKKFTETYDKDMLNDFYRYWAETDVKEEKMRFEFQKTWNLNLRLATWKRNAEKQFKAKNNSEKPKEEKIGRTTIETIKKNAEYNGEY